MSLNSLLMPKYPHHTLTDIPKSVVSKIFSILLHTRCWFCPSCSPHQDPFLSAGVWGAIRTLLFCKPSFISKFLRAYGSLSEERGFTVTDTKENQFIFVLISSLICKKTPAQYFNTLLPVIIVVFKHSNFSIN